MSPASFFDVFRLGCAAPPAEKCPGWYRVSSAFKRVNEVLILAWELGHSAVLHEGQIVWRDPISGQLTRADPF